MEIGSKEHGEIFMKEIIAICDIYAPRLFQGDAKSVAIGLKLFSYCISAVFVGIAIHSTGNKEENLKHVRDIFINDTVESFDRIQTEVFKTG